MQAVRVILDYPAPARNSQRLDLGQPGRVISTHHTGDVRSAFREAENAARAGAWVAGFVAYEAAAAFDPALITREPDGSVPLLWFGVFDPPTAEGVDARVRGGVHAHGTGVGTQLHGDSRNVTALDWQPDTARPEYDEAIRQIRTAIAAGDVYQVNHTLRFRTRCALEPAAMFDALVAARHGRYHALIETPGWAVVSASPELFIDVRGRIITTRPMKGTARRGRWPDEDRAAAARLALSAKDRAENLMIVDLLRNDIGRVARFGSVAVPEMFAVETFPTVHQMTSTVTAQLRDDVRVEDIFAATFPCGSVTGAPKIAAMQHIARLETSPRGPYCGSVGVMRPDGSATFSVAIRTLVIDRAAGRASYGAGGGITWDSNADAEYDEVVAKAALLEAPTPEFDLLETMRIDNGRIPRLDLHLDRIGAEAQYWDFAPHAPAAARTALERLMNDPPAGSWRLRMTISRSAHVSIARVQLDAPFCHLEALIDGFSRATRVYSSVEHDDAANGREVHRAALPGVALSNVPVHSRDPLLHHKTTARTAYDTRRARHPDAFDVLLRNEHACITEFTIGNVVCLIDDALITPPRSAGLLGGTYRRELLERGVIVERDVAVADLVHVRRMWRINSVRGAEEVQPPADR